MTKSKPETQDEAEPGVDPDASSEPKLKLETNKYHDKDEKIIRSKPEEETENSLSNAAEVDLSNTSESNEEVKDDLTGIEAEVFIEEETQLEGTKPSYVDTSGFGRR